MLKNNLKISVLEFAQRAKNKTLLKWKVYRSIFWILTIFTLVFGLFSAIMGTAKIASSRFPEQYSFIVNFFVSKKIENGKEIVVDQWPIFVLFIGIFLSIINGLMALFAIKNQWVENKEKNIQISLQFKLFEASEEKYKDLKQREKEFLLFSQINSILKTSSRLLNKEKLEIQEQKIKKCFNTSDIEELYKKLQIKHLRSKSIFLFFSISLILISSLMGFLSAYSIAKNSNLESVKIFIIISFITVVVSFLTNLLVTFSLSSKAQKIDEQIEKIDLMLKDIKNESDIKINELYENISKID